MIYFDNASTTFPKSPNTEKELKVALEKYSFNAGRGEYQEAEKCSAMIDETRGKIASLINGNIDKSRVVFTSTITEAMNNILYGLDLEEEANVYVSPFEHNATLRTLHNLKATIHILPFDSITYEPDLNKIKTQFAMNPPDVVVLSQISNVVGFELPYNKIFALSHSRKAICVLDAAQGFGIYDINIENVDIVAFEGHKSLYSIYGAAGFVNITDVDLKTIKVGGTGSDSLNLEMPLIIPYRYEAGTYNSFSLYVLNKSIDWVKSISIKDINERNTVYLIDRLSEINKIKIYKNKDELPKGIVSFNIAGIDSSQVAEHLYEKGNIAVRSGFHCSAFVHKFLGTDTIGGTVRVSLGAFNTKTEIDTLVCVLKEIENGKFC